MSTSSSDFAGRDRSPGDGGRGDTTWERDYRPRLARCALLTLALVALGGCHCTPQHPVAGFTHPAIGLRERLEDIGDGICLEKAHKRTIDNDFEMRGQQALDATKCVAGCTLAHAQRAPATAVCLVHGAGCTLQHAACRTAATGAAVTHHTLRGAGWKVSRFLRHVLPIPHARVVPCPTRCDGGSCHAGCGCH